MAVDTLPSASRPLPGIYPVMPMLQAPAAAKPRTSGQRISLPRGQVFTIPRRSGLRAIEILSGTVWLTATPADQDILLHTGDSFQLGPNAPYVLEALSPAESILHR